MSRTFRQFSFNAYIGVRAGRDGPYGTGKGCGYEYWSRRPLCGYTPGKDVKQLTHQIERSRRRNLLWMIEYKDDDKAYAELKAVAS